jgi:nitrous oxide reductase accessory protein NosL
MEMINTEKAHWVIGGSKTGVMTKTGTWAFNQRKDAESFVQENGGKIGNFDEALDAVYEDMKSNVKSIRQKRS